MNINREEVLFALALEKPAEKRAAFLDATCEGDAALRARLEALLAAHEQPETLLTQPTGRRDELHESPSSGQGLAELGPPGQDALRPTIKLDLADAPDEAVGQTLGHYKLLERVGEGGCGVVYVAEQTEPVRRRVALKVIKLGMDIWLDADTLIRERSHGARSLDDFARAFYGINDGSTAVVP